MALPDVSFTNDLGTISFRRCMIAISDQYQWSGRLVKFAKQIQIDGYQKQSFVDPEGVEGVLTSNVADRARGTRGTLTVPWGTIPNLRLNGISNPAGLWLDYQPITANFVDDLPDQKKYTLSFFGLELHNPRLSMPVSVRRNNDEYVQMPFRKNALLDGPSDGVMRTKSGQKMITMNLTGSILCRNGKLPEGLTKTLTQRANDGVEMYSLTSYTGWPRTFHLGDAIPEISSDMNFGHVFIAGSRYAWKVERGVIQVQIEMLAQPQRMERP